MEGQQHIQSIFHNFIKNHNEMESIRKDILNYQKQFKKRISQLKLENMENEKALLEYMEEHKLPGIRSGDFLLLADEKPTPTNKEVREQKLQNVLENHQIDTNSRIYKEIVEVLVNPKLSTKTQKKIKFKKYSAEEKNF